MLKLNCTDATIAYKDLPGKSSMKSFIYVTENFFSKRGYAFDVWIRDVLLYGCTILGSQNWQYIRYKNENKNLSVRCVQEIIH